jgi:hypothetical protein
MQNRKMFNILDIPFNFFNGLVLNGAVLEQVTQIKYRGRLWGLGKSVYLDSKITYLATFGNYL